MYTWMRFIFLWTASIEYSDVLFATTSKVRSKGKMNAQQNMKDFIDWPVSYSVFGNEINDSSSYSILLQTVF